MKRQGSLYVRIKPHLFLIRLLGALLALAVVSPLYAQTYDIDWWTVDGGSAMGLTGGGYVLDGTAGQPDAHNTIAGGVYSLRGGFWHDVIVVQYELVLSPSGTGTGTVTSDLAGIDCGSDCTENYDENTVVTLTATPTSGSYFAGWSGAGCFGTNTCVVTMDADKSVTATFTTCSYTVIPTNASHGAGGGSGIVSVLAGAGCAWTAVSNDSWITVDSGSSGSGDGSVGYSVAVNGGAARSGTITIAGQTLTVNQDAVGCLYSIVPASANFEAAGGSGSVNVTTGAGCAWTAVSSNAWITVTSGASGSGNGSVGYSVAANTGPSRSGAITIAGKTFTVFQLSATMNCTPITSLPASINAQGIYCLQGHLATAITSGSAITINANNVTLDLNGWKVGGQGAGMGTQANGIYSAANNVTVRNGIVRGFSSGVVIAGNGARIERLLVDQNTTFGIQVSGQGSVVRHNQVVDTGGSTYSSDVSASGIAVTGEGGVVDDNIVSGLSATGDSDEIAISIDLAGQSTVRRNVVNDDARPTGAGASYGIRINDSDGVVITGNKATNFNYGIGYYGSSAGTYSHNVVVNCDTQFDGGTTGSDND